MLRTLELLLYSRYFWIAAILALFYTYLKFFVYTYWKEQGVPHETPFIPFGNVLPVVMGKMRLGKFIEKNYEKFREHRFHGIYVFTKPVLIINDSKLIDQILIKEFDKFNDRGLYCDEITDPLTVNLFNLSGKKWKKLREKLSPAFTRSKLKEICPLIKEISNELVRFCDENCLNDSVIEIKDLMSRYATGIISSIAYGIKGTSLDDPDNDFKRYGHMAFDVPIIKNVIGIFAPIIMEFLRIPYFNKDMTRFFSNTFQDAIKYRRQCKVVRKDFFNMLIKLMDDGVLENDDDEKSNVVVNEQRISMNEAQAQAFIFFLGGFETSSSTLTYLLYELALNSEIQAKVHEEVDKFMTNGDITYSRIQTELKYLNMVIAETMRKYPTFPVFTRVCNADYQIPNSEFTIERGTNVIIPVIGLHHNPDVYPDPEKFDPDRFLNNSNGSTSDSCAYLPFGSGPKYCIGSRLAKLQMKFGLVALLFNYKFFKCDETIYPIQYSKRSFAETPSCGIYLRMEKRMKDISKK